MSHFSHTKKKKTSGKGAKKLKNSGLKGHSFTKKKKMQLKHVHLPRA